MRRTIVCQAKPGPRCAGHTYAQMNTAYKAFMAARANGENTTEASAKFMQARAAYDSTPEGQARLRESLEGLHEDHPSHGMYTVRLKAAVARRNTEVAEGRIAKERAAHLDNARGPEAAILGGLDYETERQQDWQEHCENELAEAERREKVAVEQLAALEKDNPELASTKAATEDAYRDVQQAQRRVQYEAARVMRENGVADPEKHTTAMFNRSNGTAVGLGMETRWPAPEPGNPPDVPLRSRFPRPNGPDAGPVGRAAEAAERDEKFTAARSAEAAAIVRMSEPRAAWDNANSRVVEARQEVKDAQARTAQARRRVVDESHQTSIYESNRHEQRAAIAAGFGPGGSSPTDWAGGKRDMDRGEAVYVYDPPRAGFPDGVMLRVTGRDEEKDTLTLENGTTVGQFPPRRRPTPGDPGDVEPRMLYRASPWHF